MLVMKFRNAKELNSFKAAQAAKKAAPVAPAEEANPLTEEVTRQLLKEVLLYGSTKLEKASEKGLGQLKKEGLSTDLSSERKRVGKVSYSEFIKGDKKYLVDGQKMSYDEIFKLLVKDFLFDSRGRAEAKKVKTFWAEEKAKKVLLSIKNRAK